jgi:hypothetical protein
VGAVPGRSRCCTRLLYAFPRSAIKAGIGQNVEPDTIVGTGVHRGYSGLDADYVYEVVDHAEKCVEGKIHLKGVENFWRLLKRGLHDTYV